MSEPHLPNSASSLASCLSLKPSPRNRITDLPFFTSSICCRTSTYFLMPLRSVSSCRKDPCCTPCLTTASSRVMSRRSASRSGESPKASSSAVRANAASASKVAVMMYMPGLVRRYIPASLLPRESVSAQAPGDFRHHARLVGLVLRGEGDAETHVGARVVPRHGGDQILRDHPLAEGLAGGELDRLAVDRLRALRRG